MNHKISIIVPCYNCEKYIESCLKSIVYQTYDNLEIIVVNDGSTDGSAEIITRFLSDTRVKYIEQSNGGESAARNTGLLAATGEYVGFVDSDDYIDNDMYRKMYEMISESDSDMAICNYNQIYDEQIKYSYSTMTGKNFNIQDDVLGYWMQICATVRPNNYVWTRLYKRSIIIKSGVKFDKYIHSADTLFNFKLLPHINKCVVVNEGLYNYVQRLGSGIHTVAIKRNIAELYAETFQELADYYINNHYEKFFCVLPIHAYTRFKNVFFYSRLSGFSDEEIMSSIMLNWKNKNIFKYLMGEIL